MPDSGIDINIRLAECAIGGEGHECPKPKPNPELDVSTLLQFRPRWQLSFLLIQVDDVPSRL